MAEAANALFLQDLVGLHAGRAQCEPGHAWGPGLRDHFKIHLVLGGTGEYQLSGRTYRLRRGQGFLIVPHVLMHYVADPVDPWEYSWIGFRGTAAAHWLGEAGLSVTHPVFEFDPEGPVPKAMQAVVDAKTTSAHPLAVVGALAQLMASLVEERGPRPLRPGTASAWTGAVLAYIDEYSGSNITVEGIARHVGLQRSYLGTVFHRETGLSIQAYLIRHRIRAACLLLEHSDLPVGAVARSVGYPDALLFSKTFRRQTGSAPRDFRAQSRTSSGLSPDRTVPSEVSLY